MDAAAILGAVLRRCNAMLCGGLGGVDAMGKKVSRSCDINIAHWLSPSFTLQISLSAGTTT